MNCLAPTAATAMTDALLPPSMKALLVPERVSPGLIKLVCDDAPTRAILCAGAGSFERAFVTLTPGVYVGGGDDAVAKVAARWDDISDRTGETVPDAGGAQIQREVMAASEAANQA